MNDTAGLHAWIGRITEVLTTINGPWVKSSISLVHSLTEVILHLGTYVPDFDRFNTIVIIISSKYLVNKNKSTSL